jgi:hypothetical protein
MRFCVALRILVFSPVVFGSCLFLLCFVEWKLTGKGYMQRDVGLGALYQYFVHGTGPLASQVVCEALSVWCVNGG